MSKINVNMRTATDLVYFIQIGEVISLRWNAQFLPRGAQILGTAIRTAGAVEVTIYEDGADIVKNNPQFDRVLSRVVNAAETGLPMKWAVPTTFEEEQYGRGGLITESQAATR
jgi:hypothetical protein